jgi:hypothetical protein
VRLQDSVEREALGVQQPLDQLLRSIGDQGKKEEAACTEAPALTTTHPCEEGADADDSDDRCRESEPEHRVPGDALTGALMETADLSSASRRVFTACGNDGVADEMRGD